MEPAEPLPCWLPLEQANCALHQGNGRWGHAHLQALQVQGHSAVKLPAREPIDRAKQWQGAPIVDHPREAAKGLELRSAEVQLADLHRQLTG